MIFSQWFSIDNHPKINALETKIDMLEVDGKLKRNAITQNESPILIFQNLNLSIVIKFENYKVGINFAYPIFLRRRAGAAN
jgi:hypothetical protein